MTQSGDIAALRYAVMQAIEKALPRQVVVWESPNGRRYGELDQQDRFRIVEAAADGVMAVIAAENGGPT